MADDELTAPQQRAIAALIASKSTVEAAKIAGVGERTLRRWLTEPTFKAALAIAEQEIIGSATRRLLGYMETAIYVVANLMADRNVSAGIRLRAAGTILDYSLRLREMLNIEERLAALEEAIAKQNQ